MKTTQRLSPPFREIAFVLYRVSDVPRARRFYEDVLGLRVTKQWENDWLEYTIGSGTLAIAKADEKHLAGRHGPVIALEIDNWDATMQILRECDVGICDGPWDSPACLGCVIHDPDQNEIMLHKAKVQG